MTLIIVPSTGSVRVSATAPVEHLCPHVDEVDAGTVIVVWTTAGSTVELHSLARLLRSYASRRVSHEELTEEVAAELGRVPGVRDVAVTANFVTAGIEVEITNALPREPVHGSGA